MNTITMDVRTIIILAVEGTLPADEAIALIAEECGVSENNLIEALTSGGSNTALTPRRWTSEDDANIIKMWQAGASAGEIAKSINRTRNSVSQRVHLLRSQGQPLAKRETAGMNRIHLNRQQVKLPGL